MWEKIAVIAIAIGVVCVSVNQIITDIRMRKLSKRIKTLIKVAELHQSQIEMFSMIPKEEMRMYEVIGDLSQIQQSQLELIERLL